MTAPRWHVVAQLGPSDGLTGENDSRRVVSRHRSEEAAERAADRQRRGFGEGWRVWAERAEVAS